MLMEEVYLLVRLMLNLFMAGEDQLSPNLVTSKFLDQGDQQLHIHQWTTGQGNLELFLQIMLVLLN